MAQDTNRDKALELALGSIEKSFGKGAIMKLGDKVAEEVPGAAQRLHLARHRARRGWLCARPHHRDLRAGVQRQDHPHAARHRAVPAAGRCRGLHRRGARARPAYARKLGVNVDELLVSQPDHGEQALEIADTLVRSGAVDIIVIDSVAALVPKAEIEGEMGDTHVGLQARLMSQALRKITGSVQKSNCTLFFINQIRMKIGVMFGSPETTSGGNALKFYASQRLDIRRIATLKVGEDAIGNRCRVKIVKNKVAPPFRTCEFDVLFGKGISRSGDILDLGVQDGIVDKSGAWYSYNGERVGQGRDNARIFLEEHPEMMTEIEDKLLAKYDMSRGGGKPITVDGAAGEEAEAKANGKQARRPRAN
jgi:recombination protein RecA